MPPHSNHLLNTLFWPLLLLCSFSSASEEPLHSQRERELTGGGALWLDATLHTGANFCLSLQCCIMFVLWSLENLESLDLDTEHDWEGDS